MQTVTRLVGELIAGAMQMLFGPLVLLSPICWAYALFHDLRNQHFLQFLVDLCVPPWGIVHGLMLFCHGADGYIQIA
jgi:hypothetical protein